MRIGWAALSIAVAAWVAVPVATAQQVAKVARVGILDGSSPYPERLALWNGFKEALRDAGYVEGKNVAFDFRWTSGQLRRAHEATAEFVRANVDVIVIAGTPAALAAKQATKTIPILGVANAEAAARVMKISTQAVQVRGRDELEKAISDFGRGKVSALEVMPGQTFLVERQRIAELALRHRLPTVFAQREYVEAGGLMRSTSVPQEPSVLRFHRRYAYAPI